MMSSLKKLMSPIIHGSVNLLRRLNSPYAGEYDSWSEAEKKCSGYDAAPIFAKVLESSRAVANEEALFERDSVLFKEPDYSWSFLAALLWSLSRSAASQAHVLDFGGSLGSTYRQYKKFLPKNGLLWTIVEQNHVVKAGIDEFSSDTLSFCRSITEAQKRAPIDLVVCSSVLQYISAYKDSFAEFAKASPSAIIIARTPVSKRKKGYITRQVVPSSIYSASYVSHIFGDGELEELALDHGYRLFESFESEIDANLGNIKYMGYLFIPSDVVSSDAVV